MLWLCICWERGDLFVRRLWSFIWIFVRCLNNVLLIMGRKFMKSATNQNNSTNKNNENTNANAMTPTNTTNTPTPHRQANQNHISPIQYPQTPTQQPQT